MSWRPFDSGTTIPASDAGEMAARWSGSRLCGFTQEVRYFDFENNGRPFTQVAIVFSPQEPLHIEGRRVVMVASEAGHDNGREFAEDDCRREGPGPWLARRGITFIALCRLGRWNFLTDDPLGSWESIPLDQRMPVFHRGQRQHWPATDYETTGAAGVSSPTGSQFCRFPRKGSELEAQMMALTPTTTIRGFQEALRGCGIVQDRRNILLLYWGFSTGGAFLWPLAKAFAPDGIASFGMAHFPICYFASRAARHDFRWLYDPSTFRLRERGYEDFSFFSRDLPDDERRAQWKEALKSPRFKSFEDTFMFFNVAALTEGISRLWNASFLPPETRDRGFSRLVQENLELCFPDDSLSGINVLELSGTRDEIHPPEVVRLASSVVQPHCKRHLLLFLEGLHHSISADQVPLFASVWLDALHAGYFTN